MKAVIFSRTRPTPSLGLTAIRGKEIRFQVRFQGSSLDRHIHTQTHAHCGKRLKSGLQNNPFPRSPSSAPHPAGTAPLICAEPMVGTPALTDTRIRPRACISCTRSFPAPQRRGRREAPAFAPD